jgi:septal ring factor EnvC (AmiA/AmiB activator)
MEGVTPDVVSAIERLLAALVPALSILGAIAIALINRGIRKNVEDEDGDKETASSAPQQQSSYASGKFSAALLHHIAAQEKRIGELETQLAQSDVEKRELMIMNVKIQRENAELYERLTDQEGRIKTLEELVRAIANTDT